jgi:membrane protein implicated in regulation of membrane protease activity
MLQKKKGFVLVGFVALAFLLTFGACKRAEQKTTAESETTTTSTEGTETTTETQTEQMGENVQATTETTTEGKGPDTSAKTQTWTGTVTAHKAGDSLEILTVENDKKSFDLDDKDWTVTVDPGIVVGTRVRVVEDQSGDRKILTITREM